MNVNVLPLVMIISFIYSSFFSRLVIGLVLPKMYHLSEHNVACSGQSTYMLYSKLTQQEYACSLILHLWDSKCLVLGSEFRVQGLGKQNCFNIDMC
jgi:hypothetical protein